MVEVGRPLDIDESTTEVFHRPVQAYTDGGAAHPDDHRMRRSGWGIWAQEGHPLNSRPWTRADRRKSGTPRGNEGP
eukprot:6057167-Heterocapsa_arctica.AAC.1